MVAANSDFLILLVAKGNHLVSKPPANRVHGCFQFFMFLTLRFDWFPHVCCYKEIKHIHLLACLIGREQFGNAYSDCADGSLLTNRPVASNKPHGDFLNLML